MGQLCLGRLGRIPRHVRRRMGRLCGRVGRLQRRHDPGQLLRRIGRFHHHRPRQSRRAGRLEQRRHRRQLRRRRGVRHRQPGRRRRIDRVPQQAHRKQSPQPDDHRQLLRYHGAQHHHQLRRRYERHGQHHQRSHQRANRENRHRTQNPRRLHRHLRPMEHRCGRRHVPRLPLGFRGYHRLPRPQRPRRAAGRRLAGDGLRSGQRQPDQCGHPAKTERHPLRYERQRAAGQPRLLSGLYQRLPQSQHRRHQHPLYGLRRHLHRLRTNPRPGFRRRRRGRNLHRRLPQLCAAGRRLRRPVHRHFRGQRPHHQQHDLRRRPTRRAV